MDPERALDVDVVLASSNPTGLSALAASLHDRSSPGYHHWLTSAAYDRVFGPPPTAVASVTSWLDRARLHHDPVAGSMVAVHATAGRLSATLGVSLRRYGLADGHEVFTALGAPAMPASVASSVAALIGLDNVAAAAPDIVKPHRTKGTAGSRPRIAGYNPPCSAAAAYASTNGWYTNDEVGAAYGIGALVSSGQTGAGVTVAVPELAAYSPSDVAAYTGCFGLAGPAASVLVDGGAPPDSTGGTSEADLDIEQVATQAPGAAVAVYTAPNTTAGVYDLWNAIVTDDTASVISYSWGLCEYDENASGTMSALDALFERAAAQGQTVVASSGDSGSEDCYRAHGTSDLVTEYPASDPWVTAVGGTDLYTDAPETTWNDCQAAVDASCAQQGYAAAGGGLSQYWPKPTWQPAVDSWPTGQVPCGNQCRIVPDLSANAGVGEVFYLNGAWAGAAGTSVAAPLVAGLVADRSSGCAIGRQGDWAATLYQDQAPGVGPAGVRDVTTGDNDLTRSNQDQYSAETGYDPASGLGSPDGAGLSCPQAESVTPSHAPAGTTVTVNGLGLQGAEVSFGGTAAQVISSSTTSAIVVVPPGGGTVPVAAVGPSGTGTMTSDFTFDTPASSPGQCPTAADVDVVSTPWVLSAMRSSSGCAGYWMATRAGQVAAFGAAAFYGDLRPVHLNGQIVGMASSPDSGGYWMLGADGGVFNYGDAGFYGSTGAIRLNRPVVAMAATPSGRGYWLAAADGGIFTFGDAGFYGSTGAIRLNQPIVGMAATPSGRGYWLVAADGGIFTFGDAGFYGSTGAIRLNQPVVGMTAGPGGTGYRLVAADGGIFTFGTAPFYGSLGDNPPTSPITAMTASVDGYGYYMTGANGAVYAFGDAPYLGRAIPD